LLLFQGVLLEFTDYLRSFVVYHFGRRVCLSVCLSVCLYVCQTIAFESLDVENLDLHSRYTSREYVQVKFVYEGYRVKSQEQKGRKYLFRQWKLRSPL